MTKNRPALRSFESQLKEIREVSGITFQEIANQMGVSGAYISQILKRGPTTEQVERIATALDIDPETFDVYHVLRFEQDVKDNRPEAVRFAELMIRLNGMGVRRRERLLSEWFREMDIAS